MGYRPGARRTTPLPRGWASARRRALRRARHRCEWLHDDGTRCLEAGTEVDHIIPADLGGGDDLGNLQALCHDHHEAKTAQEAGRARARQRGAELGKLTRSRELSPLERMAISGSKDTRRWTME